MGKTVLLGWELGGGLGHVQPLLTLARELAGHGHRPVFALRELVRPWALLKDTGYTVLPAPFWTGPVTTKGPFAASFADILAWCGFASVDGLAPVVQAWMGILDLVRPDLVLADHAPSLCLATRGRVATVLVGAGFWLPPATLGEFPALMPGQPPVVPEAELLEVVRQVQERRGAPAPQTLPGLFDAADRFVTALPEIDPYPGREEPHVGPLEPLLIPMPAPPRPGWFAYLAADYPPLVDVLGRAAATGIAGRAYVRGAAPELRAKVRALGVEVLDEPRPLAESLAQAAVVIHHGGAATTQFALSAGRPQLCLPQHLEQALTARCLHQLGVGHYLWQNYPAADVTEAVRQLVGQPRFRTRAAAVAESIRRRGPWDGVGTVVARCLELLQE